MPKILLPTPLRPYAGGAPSVHVPGGTVADALGSLVARHEALRKHLYDDEGKLRSFVNVYKNDEDVRYLGNGATPRLRGRRALDHPLDRRRLAGASGDC